MKRSEQIRTAIENKKRGEKRLRKSLKEWIDEVVLEYRIGETRISDESFKTLEQILKRFYFLTIKDVYKFDIRQYKAATKDKIYKNLSIMMSNFITGRQSAAAQSIKKTAGQWETQVTRLANTEGLDELAAKQALKRYLNTQAVTIAMMETQWTVEAARNTAVRATTIPLKEAIGSLVIDLRNGNLDKANSFIGDLQAIDRALPLSELQSDIIDTVIDNTKKVVDPISGQEEIETIEQEADRLGRDMQMWQTIGDGKVRESHIKANGQTVPVGEPFVLQGGRVRWPGDSSLGADLSEIINCRCAAVYVEGKGNAE